MPVHAHGRWIKLAAPLVDQYEGLTPGGKREFLRKHAVALDESENSLWRAMASYRYIKARGLSPEELNPPPALISVEAVQRTGKYDADAERELLDDLQRGRVVRHFLDRYKEVRAAALQREAREALARAPTQAPQRRTFARPLRLSELLVSIVRGRTGPFRLIASDRPLLEPSYVLDAAGLRCAIVVAAYRGEPPDLFQLLMDRLTLRALAHFDEVYVCAEVALPELQESRSGMQPPVAQRLALLDARLVIDLDIQGGMTEEYQNVIDLVRAHAIDRTKPSPQP